ESFDEYVDYMTSVNLKHPTSGSLYVYEWGSDEDEGIWIPFGAGSIPEDAFTFNMGLLSLTFDGAGSMTIVEPEDPTNPETETYSVADDGVFSLEGEVSGIVNPSGDLLVIAFGDDKESVLAIGMKTATGTTAASVAGTYVGATINQDIDDEGEAYVELFGVIFDGVGTYIMQTADATTPTTGTYSVSEDGVLTLDDGTVGYITSDGTFGVITAGSDSDQPYVGFTIKQGSEKSAASLDGTYMFNGLDMEWDEEDESYYYHFSGAEVAFDGNGNYTVSEGDETETGTYSVSAKGVLTIDGDEEIGYVSANDEFIVLAEANDEFASAGIAIKKSSGMTDASLTGTFMTGFVDYSADFEMVSVEDEVNLEFLGIEDSVVTGQLESIDYEDYWVEFSFPAPIEISIGDLSISGEDYEGNILEYSFSGNLSYGKTTLPPGIPLPLPSLSDLVEDENETHFMEFQKDHLGREIWQYTYPEDDWEWIDTTDYVWTTKGDTLILTMKVWEWDEEAEEEYLTYEKIEIPFSVANSILTLGGDIMPCEDWEEDWWESWEDCIEGEYWILSLALDFLDDDQIKDYFVRHKQTLNYEGEVPAKRTKASTLPMVANMPNIFMEDIEVSGNRLYGGGYANFDGTWDRYLRILDISNPLKPKELDFSRPGEDDAYGDFDMVVKGNTVIVNTEYGPDFYDVSGDKISGLSGSLLSLNGSDDYVVVSDPSDGSLDFGTGDFTFSVWFNTDKVGDTQQILCKRANDYGNYEIQITSAGKLGAWVGDAASSSGSTVVSAGTWYNAIVSRSGTAVSVYLNGTQDFTFASSQSVSSPADLSFGQDSYGGERFDGFLDDVAIWNTALTSTQKTAVYNAGRSGDLTTNTGTASSSLVGYWKFSEASGSVLSDASTNSNDGTIYGANWHNSDVFSVQDTKCCYGQEMALQGNNLYIPRHNTDPALRILDVTVPTQPSLVTEVTLSDLNSNTWSHDGSSIDPYFDDIKANASYVFILDQNAGDGTDTCWEGEDKWDRHSVVRIHSTLSPYPQIVLVNVKAADMIEVDAKYIYTVSCGNFYVYDYSDLNDVKEVGIVKEWSENEEKNYEFTFFESFNGEIEKIGDYIYIARGGVDEWDHLGINVIDVSDPTKPVHLANTPGDMFAEGYRGGYDYPAKSVEMSSNGYLLVAQQSSDDDKGNFYVYQTDFAPQPFSLMFPPDGMEVEITQENAWEESITFAWNASADVEGTSMNYTVFFDEGLDPLYFHILDACEDAENTCTIPFHRLKNYLYIEGLSSVSGVWDVLATDGVSNTYSSNGPYKLTIDASTVSTVDENNLPMDFALHANFPNPFNPTTSIKYDLPENAAVSLMIYDIMGREIRHLVNETQNAGFKAIMWDGT
ncbi:MAG: LamG domain-containing protein, partial [Candidatus Poribacteria bacterium]